MFLTDKSFLILPSKYPKLVAECLIFCLNEDAITFLYCSSKCEMIIQNKESRRHIQTTRFQPLVFLSLSMYLNFLAFDKLLLPKEMTKVLFSEVNCDSFQCLKRDPQALLLHYLQGSLGKFEELSTRQIEDESPFGS